MRGLRRRLDHSRSFHCGSAHLVGCAVRPRYWRCRCGNLRCDHRHVANNEYGDGREVLRGRCGRFVCGSRLRRRGFARRVAAAAPSASVVDEETGSASSCGFLYIKQGVIDGRGRHRAARCSVGAAATARARPVLLRPLRRSGAAPRFRCRLLRSHLGTVGGPSSDRP